MNVKTRRMALFLLLAINLTALLTFAYNRWIRPPGASRAEALDPAGAFSRQLCLTGRQEKCIRDFRSAFESQVSGLRKRMREKQLALVEEMKKSSPDLAALDRLIEDIGRLQADIQKKAVEHLLQEKDLLTDDQREKFFRLFEDHVCSREDAADCAAPALIRGGDADRFE